MTERQLIAYGLIGLMFLAIAAVVFWRLANTHEKKYVRSRKRDHERYVEAMNRAEGADEHPTPAASPSEKPSRTV